MIEFLRRLHFRLFSRRFRVVVTDPEEIARIRAEFGIEPRQPPHVLLIDASEYGRDGPLPADLRDD